MQVRIATLNVWALPTPLGERVPERMAAISAKFSDLAADVVALQEVWSERARDTLIAGGRRAGFEHIWHNEVALGGSGLVVLSRHPIASARFQRFALRGLPEEIGGDFYGGKGFVRLVLDAPEGPFALINTHLHARYASRVPHEYQALRAGQIVELALAASDPALPLLAIGDFNLREDDVGHRVLTGLTGLRDVAAELDRRQATVQRGNAYRSSRRAGRRIDYVFARDGANRRVRPRWITRAFDETIAIDGQRANYSDHAGLLAEIEINPDAFASPDRPTREAVELARALLAEGHAQARERQRGVRAWAGAGFGGALLASAGVRGLSTTRRRLLRGALRGTAVLALTPSLGLSLLSEIFVPDELRAFDDLAGALVRIEQGSAERLA